MSRTAPPKFGLRRHDDDESLASLIARAEEAISSINEEDALDNKSLTCIANFSEGSTVTPNSVEETHYSLRILDKMNSTPPVRETTFEIGDDRATQSEQTNKAPAFSEEKLQTTQCPQTSRIKRNIKKISRKAGRTTSRCAKAMKQISGTVCGVIFAALSDRHPFFVFDLS